MHTIVLYHMYFIDKNISNFVNGETKIYYKSEKKTFRCWKTKFKGRGKKTVLAKTF